MAIFYHIWWNIKITNFAKYENYKYRRFILNLHKHEETKSILLR